jgi:hypothetical protein
MRVRDVKPAAPHATYQTQGIRRALSFAIRYTVPGRTPCRSSASSTSGSIRPRPKRRAGLEDGMRCAHDPAKGLRLGKALALPRGERTHLVFGMG